MAIHRVLYRVLYPVLFMSRMEQRPIRHGRAAARAVVVGVTAGALSVAACTGSSVDGGGDRMTGGSDSTGLAASSRSGSTDTEGSDDDTEGVQAAVLRVDADPTTASGPAGDADSSATSVTSASTPTPTSVGAGSTTVTATNAAASGPSTATPGSAATTTGSTASPTTATTRASVATSSSRPTTTAAPSGGGHRSCRGPSGGRVTSIDFVAMAGGGSPVDELNRGSIDGRRTFLRTVFELASDRMRWGSDGVELTIDLADPAATDNRYRAELRETVIDQPIPVGTTQAYCMRFRVNELPDLYGPVKIFQRFNRDLDGPDIGVELTGANQFRDAVPNDLQVVAWDGRHRIGRRLDAVNTLLVVVHNHPTDGAYKVVLNGSTLRQRTGVDTVGAEAGGWSQFGLYPHGLYDDDGPNRQNQIDSGRTRVRFEYRDFTITHYPSGVADLRGFDVG